LNGFLIHDYDLSNFVGCLRFSVLESLVCFPNSLNAGQRTGLAEQSKDLDAGEKRQQEVLQILEKLGAKLCAGLARTVLNVPRS
jgi:hypothetical protein